MRTGVIRCQLLRPKVEESEWDDNTKLVGKENTDVVGHYLNQGEVRLAGQYLHKRDQCRKAEAYHVTAGKLVQVGCESRCNHSDCEDADHHHLERVHAEHTSLLLSREVDTEQAAEHHPCECIVPQEKII